MSRKACAGPNLPGRRIPATGILAPGKSPGWLNEGLELLCETSQLKTSQKEERVQPPFRLEEAAKT
jgi:hypothetical protein